MDDLSGRAAALSFLDRIRPGHPFRLSLTYFNFLDNLNHCKPRGFVPCSPDCMVLCFTHLTSGVTKAAWKISPEAKFKDLDKHETALRDSRITIKTQQQIAVAVYHTDDVVKVLPPLGSIHKNLGPMPLAVFQTQALYESTRIVFGFLWMLF